MIVERTGPGTFSIETFEWQRQMLTNLTAQLRDLLLEGTSPLLQRLYPTAYANDAKANEAYEELVHDQLLESRLASLDTVDDHIAADQPHEASEEEVLQWMQAINSLRLALGTRLDVSEEDDPADLDPDDPDHQLWMIYHLLSEMLALVIDALSS